MNALRDLLGFKSKKTQPSEDKQESMAEKMSSLVSELIRNLSFLSPRIKQFSVDMLRQLACDSEKARTAILELGGVAPLLELLSDTNTEANTEIRRNAAAVLMYLAMDATKENTILISSIAFLVKLLCDIDPHTKYNATMALWYLTRMNHSNQMALIEAKGIKALQDLLKSEKNIWAEEMIKLCQSASVSSVYEVENDIKKYIGNLESADSAIKKSALQAILDLTYGNSDNLEAIIRVAGGMESLLRLLGGDSSGNIQKNINNLTSKLEWKRNNAKSALEGIWKLPKHPKKVELVSNVASQILMQQGTAFYDQNNHNEALKCFREVIDIDPNHVDAWYHIGIVEHVLAQYPEALASYSRATQLNPMFINGLLGKARMQSYLGYSLESFATYSQIISLEPQHQEALHEREQLFQQINVSAIQKSQKDVFELTKQRLTDLMKHHEAILTSSLDAKLQDYLRLQQNILAEHNAFTQQEVKILVEKMVMSHGTIGMNTAGLQQDVLKALTELANIKYQLEMQCNKTLTQEQILNKLNVAFGHEAEQRIRFQSFKEELKSNPSRTVFFIEFVIGFSAKIESARLLQSGYFDLAASHAEQGVGLVGSLASGLPGIGGLASIGAQGTAMVINMYRQREIARGTQHLDILTADVSCLSQELGCLIIRHYHKVIDSVYKVNKVSTAGKLSLGLFSATDEEVRLKMGQKLVREAAKKAVDCLVEYLQSSELTSGPIVNQLLTVIECHIERIFGAQHLASNTADRTPEAAPASPASSRQALHNANEIRELKTQVELLKIQGKFREQRNNSNTNGNPGAQGFNFSG